MRKNNSNKKSGFKITIIVILIALVCGGAVLLLSLFNLRTEQNLLPPYFIERRKVSAFKHVNPFIFDGQEYVAEINDGSGKLESVATYLEKFADYFNSSEPDHFPEDDLNFKIIHYRYFPEDGVEKSIVKIRLIKDGRYYYYKLKTKNAETGEEYKAPNLTSYIKNEIKNNRVLGR